MYSAGRKKLAELGLQLGDVKSFCLDCLRSFALGGFSDWLPAHSGMGSGGQAEAFFRGRFGHSREHGGAASSSGDPSLDQPETHNSPADAEGFAQGLLADPTLVFADKVVDINVNSASTHVFNLETKSGAYVAQGVVTHNCRCTTVLVFPRKPDKARARANRDANETRERLVGG